ncbi:MAG TPA: VOC family protein [Longimicrobiales bacterium]|nr:VOC family protein [Longimicrobiales bacterium]
MTESVGWHDLTVDDAAALRDFYVGVMGWQPEPVNMGGYADYNMVLPSTGEAVAGICHARGVNSNLPPQWLVYFIVADIEHSAQRCTRLGGELIAPIRSAGGSLYCVIRDPAGAVAALFQRVPRADEAR